MFGLEYTRVQVPVQLVGKQRHVDVPHRKNKPGVIEQLKSMANRSRGGVLIIHSRNFRRDSSRDRWLFPSLYSMTTGCRKHLSVYVSLCSLSVLVN